LIIKYENIIIIIIKRNKGGSTHVWPRIAPMMTLETPTPTIWTELFTPIAMPTAACGTSNGRERKKLV